MFLVSLELEERLDCISIFHVLQQITRKSKNHLEFVVFSGDSEYDIFHLLTMLFNICSNLSTVIFQSYLRAFLLAFWQ
jgi:hypothetical protein